MLSINTNLPSMITQKSLQNSTQLLNKAVERMSTGFKLNHAADNAANYSISVDMSTKISAYQVAEDNTANGLAYLNTANDSLDIIENGLSRLRSLAIQANNGTYGKESVAAIKKEATSLIKELYRIRNNTEYNGQKIYGETAMDTQTAGAKGLEVNDAGFLEDVVVRDTSSMTAMASVDENATLAKGTYSITTAEELAKLAKMQNSGKITAGSEFVLGADIDLSAYSSGSGWTPIGGNNGYSNAFKSTFDGNGHTISNLFINRPNNDCQGLIGYSEGGEIKNVKLRGGKVIAKNNCGTLVGNQQLYPCIIKNCSSDVDITGGQNVGCIGGNICYITMDNCYGTGSVEGSALHVGGLLGIAQNDSTITNCFATGDVTSYKYSSGGLLGSLANNKGSITVDNCFATGDVTGYGYAGGFAGQCSFGSITNCHSSGNVTTTKAGESGAAGFMATVYYDSTHTLANCYSTGNVNCGGRYSGGFISAVGETTDFTISNCFALGDVTANDNITSGFIGTVENCTSLTIKGCYSTGNVSSNGIYVGGLIGENYKSNITLTDSYSTGDVHGRSYVGGLIGDTTSPSSTTLTNCYVKGIVSGESGSYIGGLFGYAHNQVTAANCYVLGESEGLKGVFAGSAASNCTFENCFYTPYYEEKGTKLINSGSAKATNSKLYSGIPFSYDKNNIEFQVGIDGRSSGQIKAETSFSLENLKDFITLGIDSENALSTIDRLINKVSEKQTQFGASQNRLESALEEISIHYENLTSSRSTLRDADIAEVSSEYIRQQILQQASATLLSTANQTPALALQLL